MTPPATSRRPATFDPATDALDFYESLEGMWLRHQPRRRSTGPTSRFGELSVRTGGRRSVRTVRGGIVLQQRPTATRSAMLPRRRAGADPRRERPATRSPAPSPASWTTPSATSSCCRPDPDRRRRRCSSARRPRPQPPLRAGGRHVQRGEPRPVRPADEVRRAGQADRERTSPRPTSSRSRRSRTTTAPTNDGTSAADETLDQADRPRSSRPAGRRTQWRQIDPVNNADGGEPGGNIRVGVPVPHRRSRSSSSTAPAAARRSRRTSSPTGSAGRT